MNIRGSVATLCVCSCIAMFGLSSTALRVQAGPQVTPSSLSSPVYSPVPPPLDSAIDTLKTLEEQMLPTATRRQGNDVHPLMPSEARSARRPTAPAKKKVPLGPVYIDLVQRLTVRKIIPSGHRRGTLASRAGSIARIVYERRAVPVDISPLICKHANLRRLDPFLVKAIIAAESNFRNSATSCCGAEGLMQLMPGTGRMMGASDLYNPEQNIAAGTRYLRTLLDMFGGNLTAALAAYNAGPGNVPKSGAIPNIPETRRYVKKVMGAYKQFKQDAARPDLD